ncbi:phage portal protein [Rhodospirillum sp. A1_3_36]|uniref:phage portal protein n=1 Tax=Rhodospirillum sp. A1_3_36 TaxID=3391666 RepID=UPI0039A73D65
MNFIKRIFGLEKRDGWSALEAIMLAGAQTSAGIAVSPETALRSPVVLASVRILSEAVGQLPLHLYRRGADGAKERAKDHPLYHLVHDLPNPWTTSAEWRESMMAAVLLHGEAFAHVGRGRGQVIEIVQAKPRTITTDQDAFTGEPVFKATAGDGRTREIPREELFRVRLTGPHPIHPLSLTHEARDAIGLSLAMDGYAGRLFAKGARPSGTISVEDKLDQAAVDRMRESIRLANAGGESGGTMVLENGAKFSALQFSSVDLQFLELRRHQIAEIARVFRIPLHLLQELERATHNNAESMGQQFLSLVVLPWLTRWTQALARDLLNPGRTAGIFL